MADSKTLDIQSGIHISDSLNKQENSSHSMILTIPMRILQILLTIQVIQIGQLYRNNSIV